MKTKFIFTIGGVLSGLGKGITTASVGLLLKQRGFKVTAVKIDPYISIDAGTMRPAEHGETFVTADGGEIDQDLGNYERFLGVELSKDNNITTGKAYKGVIDKERSFVYEGRDAQIFPDLINEIKESIYKSAEGYDFCLVEVGGTTGDIENLPFLHAVREIGKENEAVYLMVTYLPFLKNVGELKTKPTQHAVAELRSVGIFPDLIITRNEIPIDQPRIETISKRCFIDEDKIIDNPDTDNIYSIPLLFEEEGVADKILKEFEIKNGKSDLKEWKKIVDNIDNPDRKIRVGMVGKYHKHGADVHKDVYISVYEAITHASAKLAIEVDLVPIESEGLEKEKDVKKVMDEYDLDGLIGPQGWGTRGVEGIIKGIEYARKEKMPYLGLCFGMQLLTVEYARNVVGLDEANSIEVDKDVRHSVVHIMPDQKKYLEKQQYGGTIRLGNWPCKIKEGSLVEKCYLEHGYEKKNGNLTVEERHRHRYEFNNEYKDKLAKEGLVFSGVSPDGKLVEAVELPSDTHPFFVGTQFHPEYKSRVMEPHPLFIEFIKACVEAN